MTTTPKTDDSQRHRSGMHEERTLEDSPAPAAAGVAPLNMTGTLPVAPGTLANDAPQSPAASEMAEQSAAARGLVPPVSADALCARVEAWAWWPWSDEDVPTPEQISAVLLRRPPQACWYARRRPLLCFAKRGMRSC